MKNVKTLFLTFLTFTCLSACGGDSATTSTTTSTTSSTSTDTTANAGAAISALFSSSSSASVSEEVVLQKIKALFIQIAYAQEEGPGDNCEEEPGASDDVTVAQTGTAGSYGPASDAVTIAESDFCANGGAWSTYTVESTNPVTFDCGGTTVVMIGGSGVWDSDADTQETEVAGSFTVAEDASGTNSAEVDCHGTFQGTEGGAENFDMNCADSDGNAVTLLDDAACTQS